MEEEENLSFDEIDRMEESNLSFDSGAVEVSKGFCNECNGKLVNVVENRDFLDGSISFHIIKLRCDSCGKEYLDLSQADKYDFILTLERAIKNKVSLNVLAKKISVWYFVTFEEDLNDEREETKKC